MTGKSIIRRQKNRDIDRTELDRFSTGRVRLILLQNKNRMESMPGTVLSIESIETLYLLVGRKAEL